MEEPVITEEITAASVLPEEPEPSLMEEISIDSLEMPDLEIPDLEIPDFDLSDLDLSDIAVPAEEHGAMDDGLQNAETEILDAGMTAQLQNEETEVLDAGMAGEPQDWEEAGALPALDTGEGFSLEGIGMPEDFQEKELSIDGLDEAIQSETELQMAGELNIDELEFGDLGSETGLSDLGLDDSENDASISMDDNLEDVLNMLDDDAELAEINDMLKKSDNNEPIQDDMMDLLHQMADDEAASVNAGITPDDDDMPLPAPSQPASNADQTEEAAEGRKKKKGKKAAAKKKKGGSTEAAKAPKEAKEPGKLGKFFNMLTEEFVPEPTEEELAAEEAAKAAKKQENLTKKEEEKLAKKEEKKAKAEEKAAANKAKQDAAAQKKKEKQAQKAAKDAAKKEKLAAEGPKKRVPPKKIAAAVVFGASVGGAVIVATNILSTQGFLQTARNAYYEGDYKTVYEATYGMELDDSETDGLIKARSEVILKVQRRYDSYQTNLKMGREVEALDALLRGITAYDSVNADAEKYEVMAEVDAVKTDILNTLEERYGLDEAAARALIGNEDALSYTIALNDVIAGN